MGEAINRPSPSAPASVLGRPSGSPVYGVASTQPWVCLLKTPVCTDILITRALLVNHLSKSFLKLLVLNYGLVWGL